MKKTERCMQLDTTAAGGANATCSVCYTFHSLLLLADATLAYASTTTHRTPPPKSCGTLPHDTRTLPPPLQILTGSLVPDGAVIVRLRNHGAPRAGLLVQALSNGGGVVARPPVPARHGEGRLQHPALVAV